MYVEQQLRNIKKNHSKTLLRKIIIANLKSQKLLIQLLIDRPNSNKLKLITQLN